MAITSRKVADYKSVVFFTGAGMSAESGVPTYRGAGGIWKHYNWEEYACESAFQRHPEKVLRFHELRRRKVGDCMPHPGHEVIAGLELRNGNVTVVTQNIDGLHQRAGSRNVLELHGSLWRLRCSREGTVREDSGLRYSSYHCGCGAWWRPDIVWFGDPLDREVMATAMETVRHCDLFISVGTSGVVWPAAGLPQIAQANGASCIEINPETTELSQLYDEVYRQAAGEVLPVLFPETAVNLSGRNSQLSLK